jgi:hypothetical protein
MEKRHEKQLESFLDVLTKRLTLSEADKKNFVNEVKEKQTQEIIKIVTERLESRPDRERKLLNSQPNPPAPTAPPTAPPAPAVSTKMPGDRPFGVVSPGSLDKVCWTDAVENYYIPEFATDDGPSWTTLEDAKLYCELYQVDCSGITRTLSSKGFSYEARAYYTFRPSTSNETSWVKYKCHGNETDPKVISAKETTKMLGVRNTSVPKGFYVPSFNCNQSSAKSAIKEKKQIERIWVWGERNSGTGLTQTLLDQNFVLSEKVIGGLPWKHGWMHQQDLTGMHKTLNVLLVKDAYAWLGSMQKAPIHAPDHADLPMEVFLLQEWCSERNAIEVDKHPLTSKRLANIFQVRVAKLLDWEAVAPCLPYVYILRYEDLIANMTAAILDIAQKFKLKMKGPKVNTSTCVISFGGCANQKKGERINQTKVKQEADAKAQYYLKRQFLENFEKSAADLVAQNLDYDLERKFGYEYDYVPSMILNRERSKANKTPEMLQAEKRAAQPAGKKKKKNKKKWRGI